MTVDRVRLAAVKAVDRIRRERADARESVLLQAQAYSLDPRDLSFLQALVFGVTERLTELEFRLRRFIDRKPDPYTMAILLCGAYQILYMDRVPDSAACNESVTLVRKSRNPKAAGMVNAVLRRVSAEKELPWIRRSSFETAEAYLAVRYSVPQYVAASLVRQHGEAFADACLAQMYARSELPLRANTLRISPGELAERTGALPMKHAPYGLLLAGSGEITAHEGFEEGLWFVQDEAAQLAVLAAGVKPGTVVVDACAAPGGKTLGMAMDMENRGSIHSFDVDEEGLEKLCASALRLGINCVTANKASSLEKIEVLVDAADTVFCDVPCSGFGVMGKKPDIRLKPYDEVKHLPAKQLAILENVSRYVRPGGTLLYATCTVLSEENEQVREAFLRKHTEFSPASFELPGFNLCDQLTFFPHLHGTDGFYIAKFIRKRCEA